LKETEVTNYLESDFSGREATTLTYANGEYLVNRNITTLKNKEMVLEGTINSSGSVLAEYRVAGSIVETYSSNSTTKGSLKAECTRK
jgi:hypothetical protein